MADWWHTANLLAQFYNANKSKEQPKHDAYKFHPYAKKPKTAARRATPEDLERLFGPDWQKHV